jgi:plasmid stabilization system protein ParE
MSSIVVFRRIAKRELDDAISWYENRREGLGQDFSIAVEREIERIASSPNQFARVKKEVRRAVLRRFPYSIYFVIEDPQVVVLAIFHAKRAPEHLENRF